MLAGRALRPDHGEQNRHGSTVDRFEVYRTWTQQDGTKQSLEAVDCAVRNGNAAADTRRLQLLAVHEYALDFVDADGLLSSRKELGEASQCFGLRADESFGFVGHGNVVHGEDVEDSH